ncbi:MAG: cytochrome-c peroxidase, partial [Oligoflexia bacterium]|nr:cytochrome-c peroxidase [Oligoflexia bacterium]
MRTLATVTLATVTLATATLLTLAACGTTVRDADPSKPGVAGPKATPADVVAPVSKELQAKAVSIFKPLPAAPVAGANSLTDARVGLGRLLFFDARLSKGQQISCNTCHLLDQYGVDGKPTSTGHKGQTGTRNSPTVYNASLQASQFWDGRAADVEEQASGPMLNPVEMAMADGPSVTALLKSIPGYAPLFAAAFPDST